jgi:O-succinylbenzoate synthase
MRIDRLDVYHVAMRLRYPWRTSYGEDADIHSLLVKTTCGEHEAWSESTPMFAPTYMGESAGGAFYHVSKIFGPHVVGREYETAGELNERLEVFRGNTYAKAAIEIGWWALQARMTGTPLHRLLGGRSRPVSVGADFGIQDSFDMLLGNIQSAVDAGFPRVKLKIAPGWDLDMLRVVRETFPAITLHVDCNCAYTLDDLALFREIDRFNLAFIEQPLGYGDVLDHAELAKRIRTPICLDETIVGVRATEQALRVGACEFVNIKPGRVGGLTNALAIHDLCRDAGVPVWIGGMLESALGAAICVELATLDNVGYPGDIWPSARAYETDLSAPPLELSGPGTFDPSSGPLPEPDPERLAAATVQSATVLPQQA